MALASGPLCSFNPLHSLHSKYSTLTPLAVTPEKGFHLRGNVSGSTQPLIVLGYGLCVSGSVAPLKFGVEAASDLEFF